jgi:RND superfamily putative drug exporter
VSVVASAASTTPDSRTLAISPFWLTAAHETVQRLQHGRALAGVNVHIQGSAAIELDALQAVYASFPTMVVITTLVVFVLTGVSFRSVFTPLRSILSICLTLAFTFGLGVLVYQHGVFDWTGLRALTSIGDEVCWLVPIMAFSIIVGLTLDYDVFLISRILEYRLEGYEHKTSIACGLDATGGILTAAGIIMAFAFGSLMLSFNPVLYQWSFLLTTAVLLDTFVIRTVVVPIVTGLAGRHCWWPRQLPEGRICMEEYQDRSEETYNLLQTFEESSEYEPLVSRTPRSP